MTKKGTRFHQRRWVTKNLWHNFISKKKHFSGELRLKPRFILHKKCFNKLVLVPKVSLLAFSVRVACTLSSPTINSICKNYQVAGQPQKQASKETDRQTDRHSESCSVVKIKIVFISFILVNSSQSFYKGRDR